MTVSGSDGYTTTYAYDANNRLTSETKDNVTTTYTYDNNGNNISKSCGTSLDVYSYNLYNQLTGNIIGGVNATYTYNAKGIRTSKTVGTDVTSFILDGGNVVAEVKGTEIVDYIRGINLICTDTEYYIYNAHGDVVSLTSTSGVVTKTYEYDAFGNETNPSSTDTNPFRYCGEYYDTETGTYYLRARYYEPSLGRFGTEDPARSGLNWYTYCGGNALRRIDPDGENWKDILVGAVVSLDENLTGGFVLWAIEKITGKDELALESKYDFYEGKLVGDVISTVVGIKSTVDGVKTIIGSIGGGAAITVGSGGTATVAGVAVSVGGVAVGTAEIGYGCLVLSRAINNYSDDLRNFENQKKTVKPEDIVFSDKFLKEKNMKQVAERGWTLEKIADAINNPVKTGKSYKSYNKYTHNSVTKYYTDEIHYVAVDDGTHKVIQIADLADDNWK